MKKITVLAAAVVLSMSFVACKKGGDGATCDKAFANEKKVAVKAAPAPAVEQTPEEKKLTDAMATKSEAASLKACKDDKWSGDVLKCAAGAKDSAAVTACWAKLKPEQSTKLSDARTKAIAADMEAFTKLQQAKAEKAAADAAAAAAAAAGAAGDAAGAAGDAAGAAGDAANTAAGAAGDAKAAAGDAKAAAGDAKAAAGDAKAAADAKKPADEKKTK